MPAEVYIEGMFRGSTLLPKCAVVAGVLLAATGAVQAQQGRGALYELTRTGAALGGASESGWRQGLSQLRFGQTSHLRNGEPGTGLSVEAGTSWFARLGVGHSGVALQPGLPASGVPSMSLGGGYRFNGDQSLSLELVRDSRQQRLGLTVRYDWPRYFVRLAYEPPISPAPSEGLRLSAGVRF
jgi:hypothetical protein